MNLASVVFRSLLLALAGGLSPSALAPRLLRPAVPSGLTVQGPERRYTREELRAIGKVKIDSVIRKYGLVTDPIRNRDVGDILARLQRRAGYNEQITFYIVNNNDEVNASALPGGYIVVYNRTLDVYRDEARQKARGDTAVENRSYRGLLASILSHELAHHTLGHLLGNRRFADSAAYLQASREKELAADQAGAFYLLWSGWEIQDAMDENRVAEAWERKSPRFYDLRRLSYSRTHPRSSFREAELEGLRAELKRDQARFDDALTLIVGNPPGGADLAIALLDTVLNHFPYLTEAYHARATAYQQKYLNTVPAQELLVQMSLRTYSAYFLPRIRGSAADPALLENARRDYERAMTLELKPGTLSNLALIDLLQGRLAQAEQGAQRAAELAPTAGPILNNLGAVLYHTKKYGPARAAFERARLQAGWENHPPLLFNLGRTLLQLNDPGGRVLLEQYVSLDQNTDWRREALILLGSTGQPAGSPAAALASPPVVAGITLGISHDQVIAALGTPDVRTPGTNGELWRYDRRGLAVFLSTDQRLLLLALFTRDAGTIEGLRVGDAATGATTRWGSPTLTAKGDWSFPRGSWSVFLRPENAVIVMLGIVAGS